MEILADVSKYPPFNIQHTSSSSRMLAFARTPPNRMTMDFNDSQSMFT